MLELMRIVSRLPDHRHRKSNMKSSIAEPKFITAAGTPLTEDDQLHVEGLAPASS